MSVAVPHLLGVALATSAAAIFAVQFLCIRLGTMRGTVRGAVFVTLLTNVAIVVPLTLLVHGIPALTTEAILWFALAGLIGSMLARLVMFKSVETIGASRTSPIVSANVFFAALLAVVFLGEGLTVWHVLGIVLIVGGVSVISWETAHDADPDVSLHELGLSLSLPLLAALFLSFEPIFISFGFATGAGVLPGVAIKVSAATLGFVTYLVAFGTLPDRRPRWSPELGWYIAAGVTSTFGIIAFFAALEVAPVILVVPLLQTAPLMVLVLSALVLPTRIERVTWRLIAAASVVVAGAAIVSVQ